MSSTPTPTPPTGAATAAADLDRLLRALEATNAAFEHGYRLGFACGHEVGYGAAEWQMWRGAQAWRAGQPVGIGPSQAELQQRRTPTDQPCGRPRCAGCSRCIRAAQVAANLRRYATAEYPGTGGGS